MIQFFARMTLILCLLFMLAMFAAKAFGQNSHHSILAFQSMPLEEVEGEAVHIYLMDEGRMINLTRQSAWYSGIAWSWDGNLLAFSAERCDGICVHNISTNETFSIHDLGAAPLNTSPLWRPDGSLTYTIIDSDGTVYISTINLETHAIREEITREVESPAFSVTEWSADGRYLVAYSDDIFALDSQTGELLNITDTRDDLELSPTVSPDGLVAFTSQIGGYRTRIIDIDTGDDIDLDDLREGASDAYSEFEPAWLPDGRLAIIASDIDTNTGEYVGDIVVIDLDNRTLQNVTDNFDDYVLNPNWSPDSRWMAFEGGDTTTYVREIYIRDMLTGEITQITHTSADELNPIWSP